MPDSQGSPVDLQGVLEESIGFASEHLVEEKVAMVAEYPAHLPAVSGERERLIALGACLLQQAGRLAEGGEIKVRAQLLTADGAAGGEHLPASLSEGGPWVLLSVGFEASTEKEDEIRSLFAVGEKQGRWITPGCGSMLDAFGDLFWLTRLDQGTYRFNLVLPIWAAYEVRGDVSNLRQAVRSRLREGGEERQALLLMVEEDELRETLAGDLEDAGYEVVPVASGGEVLAAARQEEPDLVLLDLLARAPTAFEVAGILKHDRRTRNLPVLFLTSVDDPHGGTSVGTVSFLPRQSDTGAVISAVNAVLTAGLTPLSRVLVVEQDDHMRDHMVMTIQAQGYRVSEASRAEEAMALAERATPDVALVNAQLAQERDYWLLRGLRNTARSAEIYVMADVLDKEEARRAMKRGASGFSETGELPNLLDRMRKRNQGG